MSVLFVLVFATLVSLAQSRAYYYVSYGYNSTYLQNLQSSLPHPTIMQPLSPPRPPVKQPQSPIGYEIPCGVKGRRSNSNIRIVGGSKADPGEFPWQISLQLMSGWSARHICGGTVVSKYWVITAAHCVAGLPPKALSVVAGDHDLYSVEGHEQRVKVQRIIIQGYEKSNFTNDIALLQVDPPLELDGTWVAPLCIPDSSHTFSSGYGTVTGWGRLAENGDLPHILQKVALPIVSKKKCSNLYHQSGFSQFLNNCQMCSGWDDGGFDSCQGDSGGPLACERPDGFHYLCGIVSWGVGCARPRFPGVYTEVACYSEWIREVLYAEDSETLNNISDPIENYY